MKSLALPALAVVVAATLVVAAAPMYLLGPTRSQTPADIEWGYQFSRVAPVVTLAGLLAGVGLAFVIWRARSGWLRKTLAVVGCGVLALAALSTRSSFTEKMFSPLADVVRLKASESSHVAPNDLVLGVKHGGEAAAYPVPIIAYHHIVNDRLGTEPFVVTY